MFEYLFIKKKLFLRVKTTTFIEMVVLTNAQRIYIYTTSSPEAIMPREVTLAGSKTTT